MPDEEALATGASSITTATTNMLTILLLGIGIRYLVGLELLEHIPESVKNTAN
tara:strand:- start:11601 stop:11759 length:159 start_codon:yes stop_codon:yes gene_type:complete